MDCLRLQVIPSGSSIFLAPLWDFFNTVESPYEYVETNVSKTVSTTRNSQFNSHSTHAIMRMHRIIFNINCALVVPCQYANIQSLLSFTNDKFGTSLEHAIFLTSSNNYLLVSFDNMKFHSLFQTLLTAQMDARVTQRGLVLAK